MKPLCPFVRRAMYFINSPNHFIKERVIFDYELLYVKDGSATITIEDRVYHATVGDLIIFRPRQRHSIQVIADHSFSQPHVHFDFYYRENREDIPISFENLHEIPLEQMSWFHEDILDTFYSNFPSVIHLHEPKIMELKIFDLIHEHDNPSPYHEVRSISLFMIIWQQVLNEVNYTMAFSRNSNALAEKIKFYIDQNASSSLSMDELSRLTHFSKSYINQVFTKCYDIPPLKYHALLRMQKAQSLLRNTSMTISEITNLLDFSSLQDFCRAFKKIIGVTPSAYRVISPAASPKQ